MGRCSLAPAAWVQVDPDPQLENSVSGLDASDERPTFQSAASQPFSFPVPPLSTRPLPELRCVWIPDPFGGVQPPTRAVTNFRNRPTVTSNSSSRKEAIVAG